MSDGAKHSLLSPSSSHRWIKCAPSARLTENYPDARSGYADEGTQAHAVAEAKLRYRLGQPNAPPRCDDVEMDEHTDDYVAFVMEQLDGLSDPKVFVEQKVDCSKWVPACSGTCDALILSDGILHVIDLKYGRGVKVDAEDNDQLRIYALGALEMFDFISSLNKLAPDERELWNCLVNKVKKQDIADRFNITLDGVYYREKRLKSILRSDATLKTFYEKD